MNQEKPDKVIRLERLYSTEYKSVSSVQILGNWYVFRALTWNEFIKLTSLEPINAIDEIINAALLHPNKLPDNIQAGVPITLANSIKKLSGFGDEEVTIHILTEARKDVKNNPDQQLRLVICKAFNYKPSELNDMTLKEILVLFAQAEVVLGLVDNGPTEDELKEAAQVAKSRFSRKRG